MPAARATCVSPTRTPRPTCARRWSGCAPSSRAWRADSAEHIPSARSVSTTADILADGLARAGTARVFVVEGAAEGFILAAIERRGLAVVRAGRIDAACVMAAVTGVLTGAPGVAIVGAEAARADALPALAHARRDCAPMIVLTACAEAGVTTAPGANDPVSLDELVKARVDVEPASAAHWIAHAAQLAMKEPRGPVWLELGSGVARSPALAVATACRPAPLPPPDGSVLDEAARRLMAATRPVIVAGLQCRSDESAEWLRAFAEALPAPVLVTRRAKGVVPDPHPLCLGLFTGDVVGDPLLARADLVVAIGVEASEVESPRWPLTVPVLHLARSAAWRPAFEVVGDIALILEELAPRLRKRQAADWDVAELDRLKRAVLIRPAPAARLSARRVVEIARELSPAGTIAVADGTLAAVAAESWAAVAPGEFLGSSGPPDLPFALPAALAARLSRPDHRVVAFADAEMLGAAEAELAVAVRVALPITIIAIGEGSSPDRAVERGAGVTCGEIAGGVVRTEDDFRHALVAGLGARGPSLIAAAVVARGDHR